MILNFLVSGFVDSMKVILDEYSISAIDDPSLFYKSSSAKGLKTNNLVDRLKAGYSEEIFGMNNQSYMYFCEALGEGSAIDYVLFQQQNGERSYPFLLESRDSNSFFIYGESAGSLKHFVKNVIYKSNGIIYGFDSNCKKYIDQDFIAGKIAFSNNFQTMVEGILLQEEITHMVLNNEYDTKEMSKWQMQMLRLQESIGDPRHVKKMKFYYSTYVMDVFSFIEHVAVLVLPFWYSLRYHFPYWDNFCNGFHPSGFDTYRDFWTCKENWIDSFVETLCMFRRYEPNRPQGSFLPEADENFKVTKRLYERLRIDYRNPVHHGLSTGEHKTGLSMEVPSLKKIVYFNTPPLLRELDTTAYEQTKKFFRLFLETLKHHNPEIYDYISTGWNVPVNCDELAQYVINKNMNQFIEEYDTQIYSKKHILIDSFTNGYGYNWDYITGRKY